MKRCPKCRQHKITQITTVGTFTNWPPRKEMTTQNVCWNPKCKYQGKLEKHPTIYVACDKDGPITF